MFLKSSSSRVWCKLFSGFILTATPSVVFKPFREDTGWYFASLAIRPVIYDHHDFWTALWATSVRWVTALSIWRCSLGPSILLLRLMEFTPSLLLLPLAQKPTVGFALSNNVLPFFAICHQLSPASQSQHLKISFYVLFSSFPGSSHSFRPFQFLNKDLFGHTILLHSLQVT